MAEGNDDDWHTVKVKKPASQNNDFVGGRFRKNSGSKYDTSTTWQNSRYRKYEDVVHKYDRYEDDVKQINDFYSKRE